MAFIVNCKAVGLYNNINELNSPSGALSVADNVLIGKDDIVESRPGFEACQTGLPAATPLQMFTGKDRMFVHIDNNIYYKDKATCNYTPMPTSTATLAVPSSFIHYYATTSEIYISQLDSHNLRKLSLPTRYVSSLAGMFLSPGYLDGAALSSKFNFIGGVYRAGGDLFIVDTGNYVIRKLNLSTMTVSTVAGSAGASGSADGIGAAARFFTPQGAVGDGAYVYILDGNNYTIRAYNIATSNVTTIAGSAGVFGTTDGVGAAARFSGLTRSVCIDSTSLYVGDAASIRHIDLGTFQVTTLAGNALVPGDADGNGTSARFYHPFGMACDANYVYFSDYNNNKVKKMSRTPPYAVTTIAGDGSYSSLDGIGVAAKIAAPDGMSVVGGKIYLTSYYGLLKTIDLNTLEVKTLTYPPTTGLTANIDGYIDVALTGP